MVDTCSENCPKCGSDKHKHKPKEQNRQKHICEDCGHRWNSKQ